MVADQGNTTSGAQPAWPPPHGAAPQGPYGPPYGYPGPVAPLPSRTTTVVITFFFGLFGLIPAYLHGKTAERHGVSPGRYYTAFAITLAVSVFVWIAVVLILVFTVFAAVERSSSGTAGTDTGLVAEEPAPAQGPVAQDFVADWGGSISGSGDRWGGLSLQMGQDDGELYGGVYYDDLGCSGMWDEVARDATTITVQESIDHDPDRACPSGATRVVQLDAAGQMLVDGGGWTALLTAFPD